MMAANPVERKNNYEQEIHTPGTLTSSLVGVRDHGAEVQLSV